MQTQRLFEKYRPKAWSEVVGQDKAVSALLDFRRDRGFGGESFWITGASGTGKTTIARLIAAELASPICTIEINAVDLTPAWVRWAEGMGHTYGFGGKSGRAFIVNEAHRLEGVVITRMLSALEPIPSHTVWIFTTCTDTQAELFDGKCDAPQFLSRCTEIKLARRDLAKPFAQYLRDAATKEGLNGVAIERYERVMKDCGNNLRRGFEIVQLGQMKA